MQVKIITKKLISANSHVAFAASKSTEDKVIDWTNASDRKWFMNHLHWAVNNSSCVLIRPLEINTN